MIRERGGKCYLEETDARFVYSSYLLSGRRNLPFEIGLLALYSMLDCSCQESWCFSPEILTFLKRLTMSKTIFLKGKLILLWMNIFAPNHNGINVSVYKYCEFYITKFTWPKSGCYVTTSRDFIMLYPSLSDELLNVSHLCTHLWNKRLTESCITCVMKSKKGVGSFLSCKTSIIFSDISTVLSVRLGNFNYSS